MTDPDKPATSIKKLKPIFDPTFNWGHIGMIFAAICAIVVWLTKINVMEYDIKANANSLARQEQTILNITDSQRLNAQTTAILAQRFEDHVKGARSK